MSEEFIGSQISRADVFVAFESDEMIICFTYTENGPPMKSKYHCKVVYTFFLYLDNSQTCSVLDALKNNIITCLIKISSVYTS